MNSLHIVFDWDGTLSFIRAGWGEVMLQQWLEHLPPAPDESVDSRSTIAHQEIWALNGRPSIHQMERLGALVTERGGTPWHTERYQEDFQGRLGLLIRQRMDSIRDGTHAADHYMVRGARAFLGHFRQAGATLHIVSGTPRPAVSAEVDCLGVRDFFDQRIYGPTGLTDTSFHKRHALRSIVEAHGLDPLRSLISFGDGAVEISETKAIGGRAIAVAADEEHWHSGRWDESKLLRLAEAGADYAIPDYHEPADVWAWLGQTH